MVLTMKRSKYTESTINCGANCRKVSTNTKQKCKILNAIVIDSAIPSEDLTIIN